MGERNPVKGESTGIKPAVLIIKGNVVLPEELVQTYRNNGYDMKKIAQKAYFLAEERRRRGDPRGWNNDQNWADAELGAAIENFREEHEQPQ